MCIGDPFPATLCHPLFIPFPYTSSSCSSPLFSSPLYFPIIISTFPPEFLSTVLSSSNKFNITWLSATNWATSTHTQWWALFVLENLVILHIPLISIYLSGKQINFLLCVWLLILLCTVVNLKHVVLPIFAGLLYPSIYPPVHVLESYAKRRKIHGKSNLKTQCVSTI